VRNGSISFKNRFGSEIDNPLFALDPTALVNESPTSDVSFTYQMFGPGAELPLADAIESEYQLSFGYGAASKTVIL